MEMLPDRCVPFPDADVPIFVGREPFPGESQIGSRYSVGGHGPVWFGTSKVYHTVSPLERDRVLCYETVTTQDRTQDDPSVKGRDSLPLVVNNR